MVTGGVSWPSYTPSTEILVEGGDAWSFVGELPFGFSLMQVTSINNRMILTGLNWFFLIYNIPSFVILQVDTNQRMTLTF